MFCDIRYEILMRIKLSMYDSNLVKPGFHSAIRINKDHRDQSQRDHEGL